ncbi:MAG: hypothetical protein ACOYN3_02450 [Acidimicrobiia bacterium]
MSSQDELDPWLPTPEPAGSAVVSRPTVVMPELAGSVSSPEASTETKHDDGIESDGIEPDGIEPDRAQALDPATSADFPRMLPNANPPMSPASRLRQGMKWGTRTVAAIVGIQVVAGVVSGGWAAIIPVTVMGGALILGGTVAITALNRLAPAGRGIKKLFLKARETRAAGKDRGSIDLGVDRTQDLSQDRSEANEELVQTQPEAHDALEQPAELAAENPSLAELVSGTNNPVPIQTVEPTKELATEVTETALDGVAAGDIVDLTASEPMVSPVVAPRPTRRIVNGVELSDAQARVYDTVDIAVSAMGAHVAYDDGVVHITPHADPRLLKTFVDQAIKHEVEYLRPEHQSLIENHLNELRDQYAPLATESYLKKVTNGLESSLESVQQAMVNLGITGVSIEASRSQNTVGVSL